MKKAFEFCEQDMLNKKKQKKRRNKKKSSLKSKNTNTKNLKNNSKHFTQKKVIKN